MLGTPSQPQQKFSLGQQAYSTAGFVRRPGFGSVGTPIQVLANHFAFTTLGSGSIYHHDVTISQATSPRPGPATKDKDKDKDLSKALIRKIWARFEQDHAPKLQVLFGFDGVKNAFSAKRLPTDASTTLVSLPPPPNRPTRKDGSPNTKDFTITFRLVGELALADLHAYLQGKTQMSNNILTLHQAIDVMFRQGPTRTMIPAGRSFFDPTLPRTPLAGGLDLLSGVFLSARMGMRKMTLNVDTAYTAFYRPMNVVEFCAQVLGRPVNQLMGQELLPADVRKLDRVLRMVTVSTTHRGFKERHGVLRLTKTSCAKTFFIKSDPEKEAQDAGEEAQEEQGSERVSVAQYFAKEYTVKLRYPNLPCLQVGPKASLPMEVATIEPDQKFRGQLSPQQTSDIIKIAAKKPLERKDQIAHLMTRLALDKDPYLASIGVTVSRTPMAVDGRLLPPPQLELKGKTAMPRDGTWNLTGMGLKLGARITSLGVLSFVNPRNLPEPQIVDMLNGFFAEATAKGLQFNPVKKTREKFPIHVTQPRGAEGVEVALQALWKATGDQFQAYPDLFIVIVPFRDNDLYAEIKRVGETVLGVPTQCLMQNKAQRANAQYWSNVVLKVNTKIKGPSHNFHLKQSKFLTEPTLIVGADVTHPAPGTNQASIAAMVGSLDPNCLRFQPVVRMQPVRQEEIADAGGMFREVLRNYQTSNAGRLPKRVIMYRDGVSEGQFALVRDAEVHAMRSVLAELNASATKLTFVLVNKRHHTRFFASNPRDGDRSGNIKAGLVVDSGVTHPTDFDFFLQSQAGLQGTSRPTRYVVLHDEMGWSADDLQLFTYHQCYTYARCTRSVSVAPAAYYAHLVCFRARHHVKYEGSESSLASMGGAAVEVAPLHAKLGNSMYFM
ncbi:Piwi domain-domain-containing protein [Catenaria anguillulae PL171]|uniref:Piwi domain-domain-containing protein n=1 Tax=Catenaria anguillulae PL171 TaxID=765915 RepID=A0A1Y2HHK7_9FUNG|nr:Piwi domain-domain-containing protein [Catenaria anguillulae PL171]